VYEGFTDASNAANTTSSALWRGAIIIDLLRDDGSVHGVKYKSYVYVKGMIDLNHPWT
jgi:hypothetical protein